ncbi:MAG: fumarate hydratase C-terminal domain-containing protein, partial [Chloroflexota bacterium]
AKEGHAIGPAGPTTSGRVDPYTIPLLELGVKGFIGKGYRSPAIKQAFVDYRAIYMAAVGGGAALLAKQITHIEVIAYEDLGTEAIRKLTITQFPVIVVNDCHGGDAYEAGRQQYERPMKNGGIDAYLHK